LRDRDHPLAEFHVVATPDSRSVRESEGVAIVTGSSREVYKLTSGTQFSLDGRWTALLVRSPDGWKLAALHSSTGIFDNPLTTKMKQLLYLAAAIAIGLLVILAILLVRLPTMRQQRTTPLSDQT